MPIQIKVINDKPFVWKTDEVMQLRTEHHTVGTLVGCYPCQIFQNSHNFLPLQLLPEEATFLSEKGIAELNSRALNQEHVKPETVEKFCAMQNEIFNQQLKTLQENAQEVNKMDDTPEREEKSVQESITNKDEQFDADISSSSNERSLKESEITFVPIKRKKTEGGSPSNNNNSTSSNSNYMIQLFTENYWKNTKVQEKFSFNLSNREKIRLAVYKDLWEKDYYLTTGNKFGGDFLAYAGDPAKYHALFIVICLEEEQRFTAADLIVYGRLGNQVKKTVVLANVDRSQNVEYISLNWEFLF